MACIYPCLLQTLCARKMALHYVDAFALEEETRSGKRGRQASAPTQFMLPTRPEVIKNNWRNNGFVALAEL